MSVDGTSTTSAGLLAGYERWLAQLEPTITDVVLILRTDIVAMANEFAERFAFARVHVLGVRPQSPEDAAQLHPRVTYRVGRALRDRLAYLKKVERPQILLDAGHPGRTEKLANLRSLFFFVAPGGCYIVEDLNRCGNPRFDDGKGENVLDALTEVFATRAMSPRAALEQPALAREIAESTARIVLDDRVGYLVKSNHHLLKLREAVVDEVLTARYGSGWGDSLLVRPARQFTSRATVTSHGAGPIPGGHKTWDVPARHLRHYNDVTCAALQIAVHRDYVLPDSWHHPSMRVLGHRHLIYANAHFARLKPKFSVGPPRRLEGSFYFFDTEYPNHYGHLTTEVLSRYWGWQHAVQQDPSLRALVSARTTPAELPGFQREIFGALGIPLDSLVVIHPHDIVEVERLTAATPQFENPYYVDPEIAETWQQLLSGLRLDDSVPSPTRIFVSRRPTAKRHCHQTPQLERFFAQQGFLVFYPEDLPYAEQARLFSRAEIIAGFGGSGMFTMQLAPTARVILISGDGYNAENEHLIAAVNGNDLHYFWGRSDLRVDLHGLGEASRADFSFNLRAHKRALRRLLA